MARQTGGTISNPWFSRLYLWMRRDESEEELEHRRELLRGLSGRVLELGAGSGTNFRHLPGAVTELVAVEPENRLRAEAERAAADAPVPVMVVPGVADALPAGQGEFDAAVASLVLCSVPDQQRALAELRRVLRPGGELRFYEHVRAGSRGFARFQRRLDAVWPHVAGGCHTHRDTVGAIEAAGFAIESCRRFEYAGSVLELPARPRVIGVARSPA